MNIHDILSGRDRSPAAMALRAGAAVIEPAYAAITRVRNGLYQSGRLAARVLPAPVVSVGNLTTGGTGKTPVVRWLVEQLQLKGRSPAVLMRGYKGAAGGSDEQVMLRGQLPGISIEADVDRADAARRVVAGRPETSVFILDDGFQHRRVHRDFDLVLIDATEPFGFGHVLPRGLLREPMGGVARATAVLITRANLASAADLERIEHTLRASNPSAPLYRAIHTHRRLAPAIEWDQLAKRRFLAFAGIGNPESFGRQLKARAGAGYAGERWFPDHHDYSATDLAKLEQAARSAGAGAMVTTEKDWAKVERLAPAVALPIYRVEMAVEFAGNDGERLLADVLGRIGDRT